MKTKIYLWFFVLAFCVACNNENNNSSSQGLTYLDFASKLKPDMDYNSIVSKFGTPSSDIGSGIHIYVYKLVDSTEMWVGYADKIMYAVQMDKSHKLIRSII